jgi:GxxExxY protein
VLGPGLLESAYEECLCHELHLRGLKFQRQLALPGSYKGINLDCGYRVDILVEDAVVLELKCVEHIAPVHEAQLLTYLKLLGKRRADREFSRLHTDPQWNCEKGELGFSVPPCLRGENERS